MQVERMKELAPGFSGGRVSNARNLPGSGDNVRKRALIRIRPEGESGDLRTSRYQMSLGRIS